MIADNRYAPLLCVEMPEYYFRKSARHEKMRFIRIRLKQCQGAKAIHIQAIHSKNVWQRIEKYDKLIEAAFVRGGWTARKRNEAAYKQTQPSENGCP